MPVVHRVPHPFGPLVLVELSLTESLDAHGEQIAAQLPETASTLRRASYVAGRLALLEALRHCGLELEQVGRTERGGPKLPRGFSGSVSHKRVRDADGPLVVAAALASAVGSEHVTLGVDLEAQSPARPAIGTRILTEGEQRALRGGEGDWAQILVSFSAKEALYKAVDPVLRRYVAFTEAELRGPPSAWPTRGGAFVSARLSPRPGEPEFELEGFVQVPECRPEMLVSAVRATRRSAESVGSVGSAGRLPH